MDKKAAHSTLYECLVTVTKLTAPFTPFVAEALYQNLVAGRRGARERASGRLAGVQTRSSSTTTSRQRMGLRGASSASAGRPATPPP